MGNNTDFDSAFEAAKLKWESIIKCDLPDFAANTDAEFDWFNGQFAPQTFNGPVDDVVIGFAMIYIDGPSNTLGRAGARFLRGGNTSPISGIMEFDEDDFVNLTQNDAEGIILHEMGHILGLVNLRHTACYSNCTTGNYNYGWDSGCTKASTEYMSLGLNLGALEVENDGGGGTTCSHWEEDSFPKSTGSSELMTGFFESNILQPITRVTIAALEEAHSDYVVDYSQADPYPIPSPMRSLVLDESGMKNGEYTRKVYKPDTTFTIEDKMIPLPEPIELPNE